MSVGTISTWLALGASVLGSRHERVGLPCQDAHLIRIEGSTAIAAIADGAGSASHSHLGSALAVKTVVSLLQAEPWQALSIADQKEVVNIAVSKTVRQLDELAEREGLTLNDLATTLSLVVMSERFCLAAQIGDGRVVGLTDSNECVEILAPMRAEYANETFFLTSEDPCRHLTLAHSESEFRAVALHTDGLLAVSTHRNQFYGPFYQSLFSYLHDRGEQSTDDHLEAFLCSDRIRGRCDDDLTLVLARRQKT